MKNIGYKVAILALAASTLAFGWLAWRNAKPVCDDLVRNPADYKHELICEYGLGDIPEDQANVIMVERENHGN